MFAFASHGLFNGPANQRLADSELSEVGHVVGKAQQQHRYKKRVFAPTVLSRSFSPTQPFVLAVMYMDFDDQPRLIDSLGVGGLICRSTSPARKSWIELLPKVDIYLVDGFVAVAFPGHFDINWRFVSTRAAGLGHQQQFRSLRLSGAVASNRWLLCISELVGVVGVQHVPLCTRATLAVCSVCCLTCTRVGLSYYCLCLCFFVSFSSLVLSNLIVTNSRFRFVLCCRRPPVLAGGGAGHHPSQRRLRQQPQDHSAVGGTSTRTGGL